MVEEYMKESVISLYRSILGRDVEDQELADRLNNIESSEKKHRIILRLVDELIASNEFLQRHGENTSFQNVTNSDVFYAFKFLLGRLPEHPGIYDEKVKNSSTAALIDEIIASEEFKNNKILKNLISIRRKPKGLDELIVSGSPNKPNLLVISGCQGRMIADLMQSGGGFGFVENIYLSSTQFNEFVSSNGQSHEDLLEWADVIYTQKPHIYDILQQNDHLRQKSKLMPLAEYSGLQPDLCNLTNVTSGVEIIGPMGVYQSLILVTAFFAGLDVDAAVKSFNSRVYEKFGYNEIAEISKLRLFAQQERTGYPLREMFHRWEKSGKWMRTNNHPKKIVLTDLVRFALEKEGISPMPNFDDYVVDDLAENVDWPKYGVTEENQSTADSASLHFKRPKAFTPMINSAEFLTLREYAEMFYRSMEGYALDNVCCYHLGKQIDLGKLIDLLKDASVS